MITEYKHIKAFPNYFVSPYGKVLSTRRATKKKPYRILKTYIRKGYPCVQLRGIRRQDIDIHRLVYEAWKGEIPEGLQINHKDGDKLNNYIDNLEVVTRTQNMQHAHTTGLMNPPFGQNHHNSKLSEEQVKRIIQEYNEGNVTQQQLAEKYNVKQPLISKLIRRVAWIHVKGDR